MPDREDRLGEAIQILMELAERLGRERELSRSRRPGLRLIQGGFEAGDEVSDPLSAGAGPREDFD